MRDTIYRQDAVMEIANHLGVPAENWMKIAEEWIKDVPSAAQPECIQNNAVHLCDSCQYTYVTCPSHGNDAVFGDGKGNDNICACNKYQPISAQTEEIALHESCMDCPLYDQNRHSCPRFNKVIPETLREVQSEQRWISVTERLPEERDWYLGIFKEPDTGWINPLPFICDYLLGKKTKATTKEGWILRDCTDREEHIDYYFNLECVAWMPLPTPWEGGQNEINDRNTKM